MTDEELLRELNAARAAEAAAGAPMFMGIPDRWYDDAWWRCGDGHVSRRYLRTEERGDRCLACDRRVWLTWPEDVETPHPDPDKDTP